VAVVLETLRAIGAVLLQTATSLSADTDAVTLLHVLDILADLDGLADDFVTNDASWMRLVTRKVYVTECGTTYDKV
jgi:hypothetical protein